MRFIEQWKAVWLSLSITAAIFIVWDIIFTRIGVWGFNPAYYLPILILSLPIEEWLFFLLIPYASLFIHYSMNYFFPKLLLNEKFTKGLTISLITTLTLVVIFNYDKAYTGVNYSLLIAILTIGLFKHLSTLRRFYISFVLILIPFFLVNGVLTGSFIEDQVVWYNNEENLGIRLFTIPIEDIGYAFNLMFINLILIAFFRKSLNLPELRVKQ